MKNLIAFILILIIVYGCVTPQIVQVDKPETIHKIDSLKNLVGELQNIIKNHDINVCDSVNLIDSLRIIDSVNYIDSLRIRDSVNVRDSVIEVSQRESFLIPDTSLDNHNYNNNFPSNLYDGDLSTRWLDSTFHQIAVFDFGEFVYIDSLFISTYDNLPTRINIYNIENLQTDSLQTSNVLWSGFKIDFYGRLLYFETVSSENDWSDITEVKFKGRKLQ